MLKGKKHKNRMGRCSILVFKMILFKKTRKKKKSKVAAVNEFGGFVSATSSEQMFSDVSTQNSLNLDLPSNEHRDSDVNVHKKQELSDDICKVFPEKCKKGSHELSNASRSMIDELFDKSAEEQDANLVNKIHAVIFLSFSMKI